MFYFAGSPPPRIGKRSIVMIICVCLYVYVCYASTSLKLHIRSSPNIVISAVMLPIAVARPSFGGVETRFTCFCFYEWRYVCQEWASETNVLKND